VPVVPAIGEGEAGVDEAPDEAPDEVGDCDSLHGEVDDHLAEVVHHDPDYEHHG
jgi:hypothetical protein